MVKTFYNDLDPKVKICLEEKSELQTLVNLYKLGNHDFSYIESKIKSYINFRYKEVMNWVRFMEKDWKDENYFQTGYDLAYYGHKIVRERS